MLSLTELKGLKYSHLHHRREREGERERERERAREGMQEMSLETSKEPMHDRAK